MPGPSEILPAFGKRLAGRLLDFELLDEANPPRARSVAECPAADGTAYRATVPDEIATTGSNTGLIRRYEMIDRKRHVGSVLLGCLAFFFLLSLATPTHPAKPFSSIVNRDLGNIPPVTPSPLPARSQQYPFDRLACRLKCEQIGFWDMEQGVTDRLVTACKIGCNVGQDYCL